MKKNRIFAFVALMGALVACKPAQVDVPSGYGTLAIGVKKADIVGTKAVSAYQTAQTYESQVNKVQVFIFYSGGAQDGVLAQRLVGTTATAYETTLPAGSYDVYVQVNGADRTPANLAAFNAYTADLAVNSTTASTGFLMLGNNSATVTSSGGSCEVTVNRLLNRIAVQKITNGLPSTSITVDRVWLANVVSTQNYANSINGSSRSWVHKFSRNTDFTSPIPELPAGLISSFTAPILTSKAPNAAIAAGANVNVPASYLLYAYANLKAAGSAEDATKFTTGTGDDKVSAWTATKTRLVVEATIGATKYYYPCDITLGGMNNAHTVEMTISGPGLTDPQGDPAELSKAAFSVSITVAGWADGDEYELNY